MAGRWLPPEAHLFRTMTDRPALFLHGAGLFSSWDADLAKAAVVGGPGMAGLNR